MTASTFSQLPLMAGSAIATTLGRVGLWTFSRYMRAPLASTGLLAMVTLTALAGSNALYFQTTRHPAPFFGQPSDVPVSVARPAVTPDVVVPAQRTELVAVPSIANETTGSVAPLAAPVVPDRPVGNKQAFEVQKKLTELGLFQGTVDGFYGPMTARAIRAFEERNGLIPTGALTQGIVDAILRADASGIAPQAVAVQPQPAPVIARPAPVQQATVQPQVSPQPVQQADQVVARLPELSPVDNAVDTVGNAAAQTIDSIVAAVGGSRSTPSAQQAAPIPALPMMATSAQPMPAPVQVASLAPMGAPRPVETIEPPVPDQQMAATTVAPANNVQLVSQIQRGLASLGFYQGSIDGHPGDATAKAIREFENFHSYRVTGQIKPDLVGLLREADASF